MKDTKHYSQTLNITDYEEAFLEQQPSHRLEWGFQTLPLANSKNQQIKIGRKNYKYLVTRTKFNPIFAY